MNILVLGAHGMAGHVIAQYFLEHNHNVVGFARQNLPWFNVCLGDARNKSDVEDAVLNNNFDVVINCIGILNHMVDDDLENGIYINSYLPHYVASCCHRKGCKFIHISTDCVFTGKKGKYSEKDIPDEVSYYGRTKYLGEVTDHNNLTFRTSIIGPELKQNGIGLYHWFMQQNNKITGYTKAVWSGVTTIELAKAIHAAIKVNLKGLYHLTNNESITKYELLVLLNRYCRKEMIDILQDESFVSNKSILCTRKDFPYCVSSYDDMVLEMAEWIKSHRMFYSLYEV